MYICHLCATKLVLEVIIFIIISFGFTVLGHGLFRPEVNMIALHDLFFLQDALIPWFVCATYVTICSRR